jgi:predicted dithiol-disulfide oxidoreductase (DUF899 family)
MWADSYDGIVAHLEQRINFAVAIAGDVDDFRALARSHGWSNFNVVSTAKSSLKVDLEMEDEQGEQLPGASVFSLHCEGVIYHYYRGRGDGLRSFSRLRPALAGVEFPDLAPQGRGDWMLAMEQRHVAIVLRGREYTGGIATTHCHNAR